MSKAFMKEVYCWKCKSFVPMLDKSEYEFYSAAHRRAIKAIQRYRAEKGVALKDVPIDEVVQAALDIYENITGYKASTDQFDHLIKHVVTRYGPPCKSCGKNLRTPKAKYCVECGVYEL